MLVLPVEVDERCSEFSDHSGRGRRAPDPGTVPSGGGDLASQDQQAVVQPEPEFVDLLSDARQGNDVEHGLDRGPVGAGPDDVRRGAFAEQEAEGTEEDAPPAWARSAAAQQPLRRHSR